MKSRSLAFPHCALASLKVLQGSSVLMVVLMAIAFLAGCENTKPKSQADQNSILKEPDKGRAVHGEVGAMYGRSG